MTQILQDLIARLDLYLPWLLPTLETVEQTVPAVVRVTICALLVVWFALLRQRNATSAGHLHRALL